MPKPPPVRGEAEYNALLDALTTYTPPCTDDDRYTADDIDDATRVELVTGCDLCRISDLCRAYASKARPTGGIWAGRTYARNTARTGTKEKK